jgi:GntR family transcriptional regulator
MVGGKRAAVTPKRLERLETRSLPERARLVLLESISRGAFPTGHLPSEEQLARELGVSRTTVRAALRSLEESGIVTRQHGVGTRVNYHVVRAISLNRVVGFFQLIEEAGYAPAIPWTKVRNGFADADAARRLGTVEGSPLTVIERLFHADGTPVIHLIEQVPPEAVDRPFEAEEVPESIFAFAETFCRSPIDHSVVEIVPAVADAGTATHLPLSKGEPLLRLIETHYSPEGDPFIVSVIHVYDGVVRFTVVRRRG